jgi:hypothetical protein
MKANKKDKIRKNIDLTPDCVKVLTKDAVDNETVFKHHVENMLEKKAEEIKKKKK